jgi:hypothetical protein
VAAAALSQVTNAAAQQTEVTVYKCPLPTDVATPVYLEKFINDTSLFSAGAPIHHETPPTATLLPAVHPSTDIWDHENLVPQPNCNLYYAQSGQSTGKACSFFLSRPY